MIWTGPRGTVREVHVFFSSGQGRVGEAVRVDSQKSFYRNVNRATSLFVGGTVKKGCSVEGIAEPPQQMFTKEHHTFRQWVNTTPSVTINASPKFGGSLQTATTNLGE